MKRNTLLLLFAAGWLGWHSSVSAAQGFDSGSDGSMGALVVNANTNFDLPPDGIFKFTTVTVNTGQTLRFNRNPMNTPIYLLATGDVIINGTIDVSGSGGGFGASLNGGAGGPGGFDGGRAGGDGHGPGGGRTGVDGNVTNSAGSGTYSAPDSPNNSPTTNRGAVYGSPLLVPLVGGSGGGGNQSSGGGGGGGAILIASSTRIVVTASGTILSSGGGGPFARNGGSSGAIRLVAPAVQGNASLSFYGEFGGDGRCRVDTIDRTGLALRGVNGKPISVGSFMVVFPPGNPRLDVIAAADATIPEGTNSPAIINLPFDSDTNRTVTVQARNFNAIVPIEVVLTPDTGPSIVVQAQIDNATANPATVTVPVGFPVNTPVAVNAWRR